MSDCRRNVGVSDEDEDCPEVNDDDGMQLTFVVDPSAQQVSIHLDGTGVSYLMARLGSIRRQWHSVKR